MKTRSTGRLKSARGRLARGHVPVHLGAAAPAGRSAHHRLHRALVGRLPPVHATAEGLHQVQLGAERQRPREHQRRRALVDPHLHRPAATPSQLGQKRRLAGGVHRPRRDQPAPQRQGAQPCGVAQAVGNRMADHLGQHGGAWLGARRPSPPLGTRLVHLRRALARDRDPAGRAGRQARLRVGLRDPHRRPRLGDHPDGLRGEDRAHPARHRRPADLLAHPGGHRPVLRHAGRVLRGPGGDRARGLPPPRGGGLVRRQHRQAGQRDARVRADRARDPARRGPAGAASATARASTSWATSRGTTCRSTWPLSPPGCCGWRARSPTA